MIKLKVGSRASQLALWQANYFINELKNHYPQALIDLVTINTTADKHLNKPLRGIGGKGLFVKELEQALLSEKIDVAVHSLKDMPEIDGKLFKLMTVLPRANPADAFLSNKYKSLKDMPSGALVGTSSLRRLLQVKLVNQNLKINNLRGNVNSRIKKMIGGDFDAIILAAAGLLRLGVKHDYYILDKNNFFPAAAQGCLAAQFLVKREDLIKPISALVDAKTFKSALCERSFLKRLGGDCFSAIAANATLDKTQITITGAVFSPFGKKMVMSAAGEANAAEKVGKHLAELMLKAGAGKFIAECSRFYQ